MSLNMNKIEKNKYYTSRFIELDILRGFAIAGMIFLHLLWDLDYFGIVPLNEDVYQFNKIVQPIFFILVGMCLTISINKKQISSERTMIKHLLFRGSWIFSLGMVITIITLIFMPDKPILFGVLHCIGLSIILSIPFLRFRSYNILFATAIILTGFLVGLYHVENPTVLYLAAGIHQAGIWEHTVDYFPLIPWFGVILLGIALGNWLYKDGKRQFLLPNISQYKPVFLFSWLGRHSLLIYLLHQPIIAGVLGIFVVL